MHKYQLYEIKFSYLNGNLSIILYSCIKLTDFEFKMKFIHVINH